MRRISAWFAAAVLLTATLPAPAFAAGLSDLNGHWARPQVEAGVAAGYVSGYPDGTFRPNASITRAEFMKLLSAAMRLEPSHGLTGFAEEGAAAPHWSFSQGYIPAAVGSGLLNPPDYANVLSPDTPITRREIVLAAVRALGQVQMAKQSQASLKAPDAAAYPDWLRGYAATAMAAGIIHGYDDGSLGLSRTATRAEALVMVQRILDRVTARLEPVGGSFDPTAVRHPAEGEPTWSWREATAGRPTVTNGTAAQDYTFTADVTNLTLRPAPGKAVWLSYAADGANVIGRLARGKLTKVARFTDRTPDLLAVDDDGRLWFNAGADGLQVAGTDGKVTDVSGVSEQLRFGDIDWDGNFWGVGGSRVYRIAPDLTVMPYELEVRADQHVEYATLADDGSLWLILAGAPGGGSAKAEAVQLEYGKVAQRFPLLSPYFGGVGTAARLQVTGRSGPFLWTTVWLSDMAGAPERNGGLYRFNLITGEFSRLVMPKADPAGPTLKPAADGGALLSDAAGKFWRLVP
jgi:hypothetical protein